MSAEKLSTGLQSLAKDSPQPEILDKNKGFAGKLRPSNCLISDLGIPHSWLPRR
jgi:hypothetical protein